MSDNLDNVISWMKTDQRLLAESEGALTELNEIESYGHYGLDLKIGGSTSGALGTGYQEVEMDLDFTNDGAGSAVRELQRPLFACVRKLLTRQINRYKTNIASYRAKIKKLA